MPKPKLVPCITMRVPTDLEDEGSAFNGANQATNDSLECHRSKMITHRQQLVH